MKKTEAKQIVIADAYVGQRIDNFLHRYLGDIPRSRIYKMLRKGEVRVNKGRVKQTYKLQSGDRLRIPPVFIETASDIVTVSPGLKKNILDSIIYEDESVLVLNKPAGMAVHGGTGQKLGLIEAMRVIDEGFETLELVHRLDRDTSGCLLFARNLPDVRRLHEAMKQGEIKKSYTALLAGRMQKKPCRVDKPLLKNTLTGGERRVEVNKQGKAALTVFKPELVFRDATLVDIYLLTGRTHQIRVHSASIGHPVVGDRKYGDKEVNSAYRQKGLKRLFLHASQLQFESPATHKKVIVEAPMDEQLLEVIDTLS